MERLILLIERVIEWACNIVFHRGWQSERSSVGTTQKFTSVDDGEAFAIEQKDLSRHLYILGSTGSGKTNAILNFVDDDLDAGQSIVVVDPRGDLVKRILILCKKKGIDPKRITLLDLREQEWIVGFDPLSGTGETFIRALHLLEIVRREAESWGVQIEETARNMFLLMAEAGIPLARIEELFTNPGQMREALKQSDDPAIKSYFSRYLSLSEDRQHALSAPVINKVGTLLATQHLRAIFSAPNPINLDQILATPGSVLLVALAADEYHRTARMFGSLVIAAISRTMFGRVNTPEARRVPARLYVDEFESMAIDAFHELIAEGRRFRFTLAVSHQNFSQIHPGLRSTIRNNVGLQLLFACGFQDARELQRELPEGMDASFLTKLQPGEFLFMPRGGETRHLKAVLVKDGVSAKELHAYRLAILERIGTFRIPEAGNPTNEPKDLGFDTLEGPWTGGERE